MPPTSEREATVVSPRRVTVRWVDSSVLYDGGWADREGLQKFMSRESLSVESCGFLLEEDEEALLLAIGVQAEDPPRVLGALVIPRVAVLEVTDLEPSQTDDEEPR